MKQSVHGSTKMMPYEVVFCRKPRWGDGSLVSPDEAEKFTLTDIVEEMGDLPEPNGDEFYRMEDFVEPYSFDSESDLQLVANNEPKQPDPEQPAEPEPVSDSE